MKYANQFRFHPKVPKSAYAHLSNVLKGEQAGQEVSSDMATAQREVLISSACIKRNSSLLKPIPPCLNLDIFTIKFLMPCQPLPTSQ